MQNRFFGMAIHDMRSPLAALMLDISFLSKVKNLAISPEMVESLGSMKTACAALNKLMGDLLDLATMEGGHLDLERELVEPGRFTEEIVRGHRNIAEKRGLSVTLEVAGDLSTVWMDPLRIRQVLDNLISNALKFSQPSGIVKITVEKFDGAIGWRVRDDGVGIAEEDRRLLFTPFGKGRRRPPSEEKCTGLGLALSKRIIEAHGGTIGVERNKRPGATFYFTLSV